METTIFIPLVLYYLFFSLDVYKTHKGILPDASNESNPFTRYILFRLPRWLHITVDISLPIIFTVLALILPLFFGLWLLYTLSLAHLGGFLSWTQFNRWRGKVKHKNTTFFFILGVATVVAYIFARVHTLVSQ